MLTSLIVMNGQALNREVGIERDRVLVVDDDADMREALAVLLTDAGYQVDVANDG